jgi:EAL domain-containing protein (putative c-di-GMP-specific phosphodiesterase class I)
MNASDRPLFVAEAMEQAPNRIAGTDLLSALLNTPPAVEYQPIKDARSLATVAYEALARFSANGRALPPDRVFAALHDNPLLFHYAELKWKRLQIELAPRDGHLFVNLDPDAWVSGLESDGRDSYLELFAPLSGRLVVEIIENLHLRDVYRARDLSNAFKAAGVPIALDDVSSTQGIVSFASLMDAHYMKFERGWLFEEAPEGDREVHLALIEYALSLSRRFALTTVLEGVETEEHLALARRYGFDHVQGFLFRDQFVRRVADRRGRPSRYARAAIAI